MPFSIPIEPASSVALLVLVWVELEPPVRRKQSEGGGKRW